MATTWIVAADDSRARVLQVTDRERHLTEIQDLVNPAGRAQDRELQTDAEPRFKRSSSPKSFPRTSRGSTRGRSNATSRKEVVLPNECAAVGSG
ncbi:MAG TPA: host attachment protein, partial [Burkholderiales bacterium]|nr:host attachment protein [Burkholderiales bacterium]